MGKAEQEVARKVRLSKLQRGIIAAVGGVGVVAVALTAPNALQTLEKLGVLKLIDKYSKRTVQRSFGRLVERGYIRLESSSNGKVARLTARGGAVLRRVNLEGARLRKPKRWDGKWRLLIFDIKEERKATRDKLRLTLEGVGFARLQNSVWIYPFDCEDLVTLIKADLKIGRDVLYIIADSVEGDGHIRKKFGLS